MSNTVKTWIFFFISVGNFVGYQFSEKFLSENLLWTIPVFTYAIFFLIVSDKFYSKSSDDDAEKDDEEETAEVIEQPETVFKWSVKSGKRESVVYGIKSRRSNPEN